LSFRPQGEIFLRSLAFVRDDESREQHEVEKFNMIISESFAYFVRFVVRRHFVHFSLETK
jgi:hypothetical protein